MFNFLIPLKNQNKKSQLERAQGKENPEIQAQGEQQPEDAKHQIDQIVKMEECFFKKGQKKDLIE